MLLVFCFPLSREDTQSADRYRISRFLEYMLKRRFRTFPDWAHRDSPGVLSFFCLWLVMWSNSNSKNSTAKKSAKSKKKSAIFSRKQRISWSCYPDLNWRPHPYQLQKSCYSLLLSILPYWPQPIALQQIEANLYVFNRSLPHSKKVCFLMSVSVLCRFLSEAILT